MPWDVPGGTPPPPPPPPPSRPSLPPPPTHLSDSPIRWGMGDFFLVLGAQILGVTLAALVVEAIGGLSDEEASFLVLLPAQALAMALALVAVARKGRGSLREDFGFAVRLRDWTALLEGIGWRIVVVIVLIPFTALLPTEETSQQIVESIEEARGPAVWAAIVLGVAVVQPAIEEVLFRGLLLRSLLRRMQPWTAIAVSGVIFGVVHLVGVNPGIEALITVVTLSGFGMVLAAQALRHGSLSRPILVHMAFNGTVVAALAAL